MEKFQAYNLFIGIINLVAFESPIYYGMVNPLPIMLGKGANGTHLGCTKYNGQGQDQSMMLRSGVADSTSLYEKNHGHYYKWIITPRRLRPLMCDQEIT